jgi:hypothetical protein
MTDKTTDLSVDLADILVPLAERTNHMTLHERLILAGHLRQLASKLADPTRQR